jgi:hypothetical protein
MESLEYIAEAFVGIAAMTMFSYLMSGTFRKLFTEPVLINYVIRISNLEFEPKYTSAVGWILHYLVGLLFVVVYHWLWANKVIDDSWQSGLLLGAASGIVGILGWMVIFTLPLKSPRVAFASYYVQLFFAHLFFAMPVIGLHRFVAY